MRCISSTWGTEGDLLLSQMLWKKTFNPLWCGKLWPIGAMRIYLCFVICSCAGLCFLSANNVSMYRWKSLPSMCRWCFVIQPAAGSISFAYHQEPSCCPFEAMKFLFEHVSILTCLLGTASGFAFVLFHLFVLMNIRFSHVLRALVDTFVLDHVELSNAIHTSSTTSKPFRVHVATSKRWF